MRNQKGIKNGIWIESWDDQTYYTKYWILIAEKNLTEVNKAYTRITGGLKLTRTEDATALCVETRDSEERQNIFLCFSLGSTPGAWAHEVVHALNYVFPYYGVKFDSGNDEHQAYYTHYLVNKIFDAVYNYKAFLENGRTTKSGKSIRKASKKGRKASR